MRALASPTYIAVNMAYIANIAKHSKLRRNVRNDIAIKHNARNADNGPNGPYYIEYFIRELPPYR